MKIFFKLILLGFFSITTSSNAFVYLTGSAYQKGERPVSMAPAWSGRALRFYVNTDLSAYGGSNALPITGAELLQSVQEAVTAWTQACRADIQIQVVGTTNGTASTSDGVNTIVWDRRTTGEGNSYGTDTTTLAAASTVLSGTELVDCDIVMNGNSATTLKFSPAVGEADIRSIIAHEIGHCLGLDHPVEPPTYTSVNTYLTGATMVQTATLPDPSDTTRRDINQDDRDGVECIYERGAPMRTGARCTSYHGTNGQGAITGAQTGGPTAADTNCGTDFQGRNARPSLEKGDGCVGSAVAATSVNGKKSELGTDGYPISGEHRTSLLSILGGTWGFLLFTFLGYFILKFRRRLLRGKVVISLLFLIFFSKPITAKAWDLELNYGVRKISPRLWNAFSGMDPSTLQWDRIPSEVSTSAMNEISATAFSEKESWGKWGTYLTISLPTKLETNAKGLNAAEELKSTSLWGLRLGPHARYFLSKYWYLGGKIGVGIFSGSQTFQSSGSGSVSYRAWAAEFSASTGFEIPIGFGMLVVEGGYSRTRSSFFTSTGNDGSTYSDFPSGTRISAVTTAGTEDVKFDGSGVYASVGIQFSLGSAGKSRAERKPEPAYDDYEGSTAKKSAPAELDKSAQDVAKDASTQTEAADSASTDKKSITPQESPTVSDQPATSDKSLADPLEEERKFNESLKKPAAPEKVSEPVKPIGKEVTPDDVKTPEPSAPRKSLERKSWEIDTVPGSTALPPPPASLPGPNQGDPVPEVGP